MNKPAKLSDATRAARREIEFGLDATRTVGDWNRYLVSTEVDRGGELAEASTIVAAPQWPSVLRESFSALYGGPDDSENVGGGSSGSSWVRSVVETISRVPEWVDLSARTVGDEWAAGLATAAIATRVSSAVQDIAPTSDLREASDRLRTLSDLLEDLRGELSDPPTAPQAARVEDLSRQVEVAQSQLDLAQAEADAAVAKFGERTSQNQLRSLAALAASEATQEIDQVRAALRGFGAGSSAGTSLRVSGPRDEIVKFLRGNARLSRIGVLAGRLRAEAARKRANRTTYARSEVSSIRTGSDIARLVPSELTYLCDDDLELVLLRKLSEGSALEYELSGNETKTRGPIVICVDESLSMAGDRNEWAAAVVLTLAETAAKDRRAFVVVHFDTTVQRVDEFNPAAGIAFGDLLKCVDHFSGGGTRISEALRSATDIIARQSGPMANADIVLVSDGADHSGESPEALAALAGLGASIHGVAIGSEFMPILRGACASYVSLSSSDLGKEGTIDSVLSI